MMRTDRDLVRAALLGFFLLPCRGTGGVTLAGRVLRFDLELDPAERARLVNALLPDTYTRDGAAEDSDPPAAPPQTD